MTDIRLILEQAPSAQAETERMYFGGQMVIGRGDDADWQIDDPDMFVSRKHCVISDETGVPTATDASTGGLFVDGSSEALGTGNTVPLENEMRLRMGDFVIRVEMAPAETTQPGPTKGGAAFSFTFEPPGERAPEPKRPKDLPKPFGMRSDMKPEPRQERPQPPPRPVDTDDDPFGLDLSPRERVELDSGRDAHEPEQRETPAASEGEIGGGGFGGGGYFSDTDEPEPPRRERETRREPDRQAPKPQFAWGDEEPPRRDVREEPEHRQTERATERQAERETAAEQQVQRTPGPAPVGDSELRDAFLRGLGLDPSRVPAIETVDEMEAMGRRFRALTDGLVHLLRTRAEEKQKVRVAQTIIGSANVNPLKFVVSTDDAVESLLVEKGQGYLSPEDAIAQSYRDLADHQVRTWSALQTALRRMIDRFEPEAIEKELEETGVLGTLLAGGRGAKLWQLYQERYRDIARAAEERFLGEVGADFRDAYENKGRE